MSEEFKHLLRSAFPEPTDPTVVRAVAEAVILADDLRRNTPWLTTSIGDDLTGTLRRAATMWRLAEFCKTGDLPFRADVVPNSTGSCHLLSIHSGRFEAHVVRTDSPGGFPKDAPIRQDRRLSNDGDLFDNPKIVPISELVEVARPYAWLAFNATDDGGLTHVCWCMPDPVENKYLARFNILRSASGTAAVPKLKPEPPKPDPAMKLKFKKDIEEQLERDRNKDKEDKKG
jgi:hypothetical protein